MSLTTAQTQIIDITEKTGSVLSVVGEAFVISTFLLSSKFRKPVNRLVFYAAWGNIFSNVATIIGRSALGMGFVAPLCQFQAFLIQWFIPADALWTFAMACNVYLSFFHHYDAAHLKVLEWRYLALCYGLPFVPALTLLFVNNAPRGHAYGDATLWCWISIKWDFLRVALFYGPVWIFILITMAIYIRVGALVVKWRRKLIKLGRHSEEEKQKYQVDTSTPIKGIRRTDEVTITRVLSTDTAAYAPFRGPSIPNSTYDIESDRRFSARFKSRAFSTSQASGASKGTFSEAGRHANKATIKYCKCALLFFIALLVTWVPSSINRINNLIYPGKPVFGLAFAASLVLPLQGFWNAVIYIVTSQYACKCLWDDMLCAVRIRNSDQATLIGHEVRSSSLDSRGGWRTMSETNFLKPKPTYSIGRCDDDDDV